MLLIGAVIDSVFFVYGIALENSLNISKIVRITIVAAGTFTF